MSSPFPKKTVYHSALVKESPIDVVMTSNEPQASKFQGKNDFISFKIDGEEHYLELENDDCAQAVTGWQGQTVTLTASGSRGDARIEVEAVDGGQQRQPARQERQQQRQPARQQQERQQNQRQEQPPSKQPVQRAALTDEDRETAFKAAKVLGARVSVLMRIAFKNAEIILKEEIGNDGDGAPYYSTEDVRALATTIFIEMKSTTDIHKLPTHWIDTKASKQQQKQPPPPPQRQPDPEPEPEPAAKWQPGDNDDADQDIPF